MNMKFPRSARPWTALMAAAGMLLLGCAPSDEDKALEAPLSMRAPLSAFCLSEPVAQWRLDETAGSSAADSTAHANHGTLYNNPAHTAGVVGGGLTFDGIDDYVEVPSAPALNFGTGDFSISFDVKTATNDLTILLDKRTEQSGPVQGYVVGTATGGGLLLQLGSGGSYSNYVSPFSISDNQWHHVLITVDRDQLDGGRFYVDDVLRYTFNPTAQQGSLSNSQPLRFGRRSDHPSWPGFFPGSLDEVMLFNRVVTAAEASSIPIRLSDYNLFLLKDYSGGHDVLGKVAAGGNITMNGFAVGAGLPDSDISDALVAGGTLSLSQGGVWGDAWYGGGYISGASVTFVRGTASQGAPIDFAARGAALRKLSSQLGALATNGTTVRESWGGVMLHGTDPAVNVFNVSASAFTGATLLSIDAPAGSLAVINIRGSTATFTGFGHSFSGGIDQHGILYNFVNATAITAQGYGFWGTVLAPYANVTFNDGSFDGGLYALSLTGNAEGHINPLQDRDIPLPSSCGTWTQWLERDSPSGVGDFEDLVNFPNVCSGNSPVGIECATLDGMDWSQTGQVYECSPLVGGICVNAEQPAGDQCLNYHVRFLCP